MTEAILPYRRTGSAKRRYTAKPAAHATHSSTVNRLPGSTADSVVLYGQTNIFKNAATKAAATSAANMAAARTNGLSAALPMNISAATAAPTAHAVSASVPPISPREANLSLIPPFLNVPP